MAIPLPGKRLSDRQIRAALKRAYLGATYAARLPSGEVQIRLGQPCPFLDEFLAARGHLTWAFVSACNPRSQVLCEQENLSRHEDLTRAVLARGYAYYQGEGRGGNWQAEPSLLLLGITAEHAARLGRQFDQNAVVVGKRGGLAQLLWCAKLRQEGFSRL